MLQTRIPYEKEKEKSTQARESGRSVLFRRLEHSPYSHSYQRVLKGAEMAVP